MGDLEKPFMETLSVPSASNSTWKEEVQLTTNLINF